MPTDTFSKGLYSPRIAAKVARIRYQSFQAWAKANVLHAVKIPVGDRTESIYSYYDLLLIRLIVRLKEQGAKVRQIKAALHTIEMMSQGDKDAWMRATLFVDTSSGVVVAFMSGKPEWNPIAASKGPQKMAVVFFPELIKELKDELVPIDRFPYIEIDPEVLGGAPVIKGTRIPTTLVKLMRKQAQDPKEAYPDLSDEQIENALAYEEFLVAA